MPLSLQGRTSPGGAQSAGCAAAPSGRRESGQTTHTEHAEHTRTHGHLCVDTRGRGRQAPGKGTGDFEKRLIIFEKTSLRISRCPEHSPKPVSGPHGLREANRTYSGPCCVNTLPLLAPSPAPPASATHWHGRASPWSLPRWRPARGPRAALLTPPMSVLASASGTGHVIPQVSCGVCSSRALWACGPRQRAPSAGWTRGSQQAARRCAHGTRPR